MVARRRCAAGAPTRAIKPATEPSARIPGPPEEFRPSFTTSEVARTYSQASARSRGVGRAGADGLRRADYWAGTAAPKSRPHDAPCTGPRRTALRAPGQPTSATGAPSATSISTDGIPTSGVWRHCTEVMTQATTVLTRPVFAQTQVLLARGAEQMLRILPAIPDGDPAMHPHRRLRSAGVATDQTPTHPSRNDVTRLEVGEPAAQLARPAHRGLCRPRHDSLAVLRVARARARRGRCYPTREAVRHRNRRRH